MEFITENTKTYKTPLRILNAMRKYQDEHREEINQYAKEKYRDTKHCPEMIEKRKEYSKRAYEKIKLKKATLTKEEKEHKTPDYTLRAVTKYQQNNRELINKKALARYYKKKAERETGNENQELV